MTKIVKSEMSSKVKTRSLALLSMVDQTERRSDRQLKAWLKEKL